MGQSLDLRQRNYWTEIKKDSFSCVLVNTPMGSLLLQWCKCNTKISILGLPLLIVESLQL